MTCQDVVEFLMQYLDDELPPEQKEVLQKHLSTCPPCRQYLNSYQETIRLGTAALCGEDAICQEIPEDLVQAILQARAQSEQSQ